MGVLKCDAVEKMRPLLSRVLNNMGGGGWNMRRVCMCVCVGGLGYKITSKGRPGSQKGSFIGSVAGATGAVVNEDNYSLCKLMSTSQQLLILSHKSKKLVGGGQLRVQQRFPDEGGGGGGGGGRG